MKYKKSKHSKECILLNKKFIFILASIGMLVTFVSLYMGKAKFTFKGEDIRIQNTTGEFHFYSSILSVEGKEYNLYDWNDEEEYVLNIDLENFIDSLRSTNENITYTVSATTENTDKVSVAINPDNSVLAPVVNSEEEIEEGVKTGILEISEKAESFDIVINKMPSVNISDGEFITVSITVKSTAPYSKTLSARFNIYKKVSTEYSLKYTENTDKKIGYLSIETHKLTKPVTFHYDSAKLILNKAAECLQDADIVQEEDGTVSVSVELKDNKIYNLNFMKIDDSEANVW